MEADKSQDLQEASWRSRRTDDLATVKSKGLRTRTANDVVLVQSLVGRKNSLLLRGGQWFCNPPLTCIMEGNLLYLVYWFKY